MDMKNNNKEELYEFQNYFITVLSGGNIRGR